MNAKQDDGRDEIERIIDAAVRQMSAVDAPTGDDVARVMARVRTDDAVATERGGAWRSTARVTPRVTARLAWAAALLLAAAVSVVWFAASRGLPHDPSSPSVGFVATKAPSGDQATPRLGTGPAGATSRPPISGSAGGGTAVAAPTHPLADATAGATSPRRSRSGVQATARLHAAREEELEESDDESPTPAFARATPLPVESIDPEPLPVPAPIETAPMPVDAITVAPIEVSPFDEDAPPAQRGPR